MRPGSRSAQVACLAAAVVMLGGPRARAETAEDVIRELLGALRAKDVPRAIRLFDDPYRVRRTGREATFRYESCEEPNLAFLLGGRFDAETPTLDHRVRSESYVLDRIHGVVMNVPLVFRRAEEAPFVLPKPISWGGRMDFQRFMDFVKRPTDPASLTLRLRPSVHPGLIRPPPPSGIAIPPPPVRGPNQRLAQPIMARTWNRGPCLFGHQPALDPGPVTLPSGDVLTPEQLAAFLPRLRRITLQVTVMQHGWFASWKLTHFGFLDPMVVSDETEIPIR